MPGRNIERVWQAEPRLNAPQRYRRACGYQAFIPVKLGDLSLSLDGSVAGLVSEAEEAIRFLNRDARPALAPLARLLLKTECIASSKIEGVRVGSRELARAEAKRETGGRVGPTAMEVLANVQAMELAVSQVSSRTAFGLDDIQAIHHRLMERALNAERTAGKIRTSQNWIGGNDYNPCGAEFVPPPPEEVLPLLDDLCGAINDRILPPLVQAALVHAQFETIHPFHDGNGRTGRALIHVVLKRRDLATAYVPPISVVLANARQQYIDGLTLFRGEQVQQWIEQFAAATHQAARMATAYLKRVGELAATWIAMVTQGSERPRSDAAIWRILEVLPAHPVITLPAAAAATGRSKPQVNEALHKLEAAGVLIPLSSAKRNRSWEAKGLLDLIAVVDAGQLPDP